MSKEYPWGKGTPKVLAYDATANDSDKSFTVPAGKVWDVKLIHIKFTTTATVGNRQLFVVITDGTNEITRTVRATVTASQVAVMRVSFNGANNALTPAFDGCNVSAQDILPFNIMRAGYVIRAYDGGAVDAAQDDMIVAIVGVEYDA